MSNGNLCIIKFKPFWLPQLPVTLEQALSTKTKIGWCYFCNLDNKYGVTTYLNFLSIGTVCSIKLKPFWLSEFISHSWQQVLRYKKRMARIIFVILANKYGITYLPQLLPAVVACLTLILRHSDYWWVLTTNNWHFVASPNGEVMKI